MYQKIIITALLISGLVLACKNQTSFKGDKARVDNLSEDQLVKTDYTDEDIPDSAITKGSFTVWTDPEDPDPYQPYHVIVQVKLDKNMDSYSKSDLSGHLVGTDSYRQVLGRNAPLDSLKYYSSKGYARLTSRYVPGSYDGVEDTITITSDILDETQTISIVF